MAEAKKKQIPLRLSNKLYAALASWAEDDFRSVNGQIEYLLTECVKQRKKDGKYVSETIDEPFEILSASILTMCLRMWILQVMGKPMKEASEVLVRL